MRPAILFGAFDRHNLGDLLFPHVAASFLPGRELHFAGLVAADLQPWGGHLVRPLPAVLAGIGDRPVELIHVGGEILTCEGWQAAVMCLPPEAASHLLSRPELDLRAWAREHLPGRAAPYVVPAGGLAPGSRTRFLGVGGVTLDEGTPAMRGEVLAALGQASFLGVRDRRTQAHLADAGLAATLMPDPGCLAGEVLGRLVAARAGGGEPAQAARRFPGGYLAWQFSGDFGDDATLAEMAHGVEGFARRHALGVVLLRAGAAPWHDDLGALRRAAAFMAPGRCQVAESLHILDICALVRGAALWCGSSLHGWVLASSWGRPRAGLALERAGVGAKLKDYLATWEPGAESRVVEPPGLSGALEQAQAADPSPRPTAPFCHRMLERALA